VGRGGGGETDGVPPTEGGEGFVWVAKEEGKKKIRKVDEDSGGGSFRAQAEEHRPRKIRKSLGGRKKKGGTNRHGVLGKISQAIRKKKKNRNSASWEKEKGKNSSLKEGEKDEVRKEEALGAL